MERLLNVDYHVTDKCNLNCVSCGHFCPLVPKDTKHKSIRQVLKDLRALSAITEKGKYLQQLTFTGGEVTLLPVDLIRQILISAIDLFPHTQLKVWTNGIKYHHFDTLVDLFKSHNILLYMTDYNQATTKDAIDHYSNILGDNFTYLTRRREDGGVDFFRHFFSRFEIADKDHILSCAGRNECMQLQDEKLYLCQYAAYSHYFNEYFNEHGIYQSDDMYIELNDNSIENVFHFIKTATPVLCRQCVDCLRPEFKSMQDWKQSDKQIDEWMLP